MADFVLKDVAIEGISCALPTKKVDTTDFYDQFGREAVDNFIEMTGIQSTYRTIEEQTASDLCFVAARRLLEQKGLDASAVGALVFISQTPDYRSPETAAVLHKRLGLDKECICFDVNLGCSGYVYGLNIVGSLFATSDIEYALLLFGDTSNKAISPLDRSNAMMFGDSGSATLLARKEGETICGNLMTNGEGFKAIIVPSGAYRNRNGDKERTQWGDGNVRSDYDSYMNGTDVFSFAISEVPRQIKRFMEKRQTSPENYDALLLHQANMLILKQICKKTKFDIAKLPITLDRFGNTSGTSIPLTICDHYGECCNRDLRLLLDGFGIGLSWGVVDVTLNSDAILPIIYSDEYYTEGGVAHG